MPADASGAMMGQRLLGRTGSFVHCNFQGAIVKSIGSSKWSWK